MPEIYAGLSSSAKPSESSAPIANENGLKKGADAGCWTSRTTQHEEGESLRAGERLNGACIKLLLPGTRGLTFGER